MEAPTVLKGQVVSFGVVIACLSMAPTLAAGQEVSDSEVPSPPAHAAADTSAPTSVSPSFQAPVRGAASPTPSAQLPPFYTPIQPSYVPYALAYGRKPPKTRRKVDVPAVVFGGTFMAAGGAGILVGFGGYFSSISCESGTFGFPSCHSSPNWLWAAAGGLLLAGAAGTPLLVVGLRGDRVPADPAKAAFISSPELVVSGPTEAALRFRF